MLASCLVFLQDDHKTKGKSITIGIGSNAVAVYCVEEATQKLLLCTADP